MKKKKKKKKKKNGEKDGKTFYKLIKNAVHGKAMEKLKKKIDVRLVSNQKVYLK